MVLGIWISHLAPAGNSIAQESGWGARSLVPVRSGVRVFPARASRQLERMFTGDVNKQGQGLSSKFLPVLYIVCNFLGFNIETPHLRT